MRILTMPMSAIVCGCALLLAGTGFGKGNLDWSGREPHPAVVDPVCGNELGTVVDLGGEWTFSSCRAHADRSQPNMRQYAAKWPAERTIKVPGSWETQGVGEPVPEPKRCCYGGFKTHFPLTHSFSGHGWYRRSIDIPAEWKGRRIWLKIGGVGCQGWFWVNEMPVAHIFDFCATRKFEITDLVEPGKPAKVVVVVSNAAPSKLGSAEAASCFGGILRPLELESTPQTFIDDAWVRGDFDSRAAEAHVAVSGSDGISRQVRFTVEGASASASVAANGETVVRLPLGRFRAWSPEHPNLYTGLVELVENGVVVQKRRERFGIRKFEVRGRDFYLNNKPFFMRGCGFHDIDPINGRYLPKREECRARIAKARAAGFNFARLHTRCESPEFFEMADELGLMLQPELPYYGDFSTCQAPFEPLEDAKELWENFRRHPSFAVYCGGNEGTFGPVLGRRFYEFVKAMDPDRLVSEQDAAAQPLWKRSPSSETNAPAWRGKGVTGLLDVSSYRVEGTDDFIAFPDRIWKRGTCNPPCPMIAHEYLNLSVKSDTRLENMYTGIWDHPVKRSVRGEWLARFGLDHSMGDRLQNAQHSLQATWQKKGIEAARKDPFCDGYFFWSLTDYPMANQLSWSGGADTNNVSYIAQGLFTPFFTEKIGGQTAAGFAAFNSPVGVFVDSSPELLHLVAGEPFSFDVLFANYGDAAVAGAVVDWAIVSKSETRLASGRESVGDLDLGGVRKIASFSLAAPQVAKAVAAELVVSVKSGMEKAAGGRWPCWLFPIRAKRDGGDIVAFGACRKAVESAFYGVLPQERAAEAKVVVADVGSPEAAAALARGQSVVEIGGMEGPLNIELGWWFHKNVVGAVFDSKSPLLKYLPESDSLSTLHFRIFKKGRTMPVDGFSPDELAVVSEEATGCFAHLGERVTKLGARHVFAHGLALDQPMPEAVAILDGLVDRARER